MYARITLLATVGFVALSLLFVWTPWSAQSSGGFTFAVCILGWSIIALSVGVVYRNKKNSE